MVDITFFISILVITNQITFDLIIQLIRSNIRKNSVLI